MTIDEIFSTISSHMAKGVKMHSALVNAFNFLNLNGYAKCQEYHFYEESYNYRCINNFYLNYYNKLIIEDSLNDVEVIPTNWYKHVKEDVDTSTKRTAIRDLFKIWINWEKETKKLLEDNYKELYNQGNICAALKIAEYIQDVSQELMIAQRKQINLETIGYDISLIVDEQQLIYDKYHEKIKLIYEDDD